MSKQGQIHNWYGKRIAIKTWWRHRVACFSSWTGSSRGNWCSLYFTWCWSQGGSVHCSLLTGSTSCDSCWYTCLAGEFLGLTFTVLLIVQSCLCSCFMLSLIHWCSVSCNQSDYSITEGIYHWSIVWQVSFYELAKGLPTPYSITEGILCLFKDFLLLG